MIISGLVIWWLYTATLHKNAILTFLSGAVYRWYQLKDEKNTLEPSITQTLITTDNFLATKGVTGLLIVAWAILCIINSLLIYLIAIPIGVIVAILIIKLTTKNFNTHTAIRNASRVVRLKSKKYGAYQLTANDIANDTPKTKLLKLDLLLENDEFISFAQKLKNSYNNRV